MHHARRPSYPHDHAQPTQIQVQYLPFLPASTTDKWPTMESHQSDDERLRLPDTILTCIISYLDPQSLARAASVSHHLRELTYSDELWKSFVNSYLPTPIESCKPAPSFRRLFIAFHQYWFIPQFRFWLSDEHPGGQLIVSRFNTQKLCIEAWAVVADRENSRYHPWSHDPEVMIHESDMRVHVDRQHPIFRFGVKGEEWDADEADVRAAMMYEEDISAAQLESRVELSIRHTSTRTPITGDLGMWPTPDMSASTSIPRSQDGTSISDSFRPSSTPTQCQPTFTLHHHGVDKTVTYGTMSPEAYIQSVEKPWQGIWCGDYFNHGVEFLLMLQSDSTDSLLAVKLTGDSNIPRWQYSIVVPDLLEGGLVRVAEEDEFRGARVVRSAGHIAATGFKSSKWNSSSKE
jgi:hypothetical protein